VSTHQNAKSIVATILVLSEYFSGLPTRAQEAKTSFDDREVFVYGREQAIVDAITKANNRQSARKFDNDLDRVFSALLDRAYPKPTADELAGHAIDAICRKVETQTHTKIPESNRISWITTAAGANGFDPVLHEIEMFADRQVKQERLVSAGLTGMLSATGSKCATILDAREAGRLTKMLEARGSGGEEPGIGVDVSNWPAIGVVSGTPAAEAGLQNGDIVLRINGRDIAKTERADEGLKALAGPAGGTISLTIKRGDKTLAIEVHRASTATRVKARVVAPGVVCVQIPQFEGSGIADKVKELIRQHAADATSGVILDLRGNPGGRAEEANAVADTFLANKCLEIFRFRSGRQIAFKSKPGAMDIRLAVLTDGETASAAEMLAMALHDNQRATVLGQPTAGLLYGKDGEALDDGRMIIFRSEPTVLSPTGNDYSETGFPPDIVVDESKTPGKDKTLERAIQLLNDR